MFARFPGRPECPDEGIRIFESGSPPVDFEYRPRAEGADRNASRGSGGKGHDRGISRRERDVRQRDSGGVEDGEFHGISGSAVNLEVSCRRFRKYRNGFRNSSENRAGMDASVVVGRIEAVSGDRRGGVGKVGGHPGDRVRKVRDRTDGRIPGCRVGNRGGDARSERREKRQKERRKENGVQKDGSTAGFVHSYGCSSALWRHPTFFSDFFNRPIRL